MRQRAADASLRRLARSSSEERAGAPLQAVERESEDAVEVEEIRRRAADAAMRRAERQAAGEDAYEVFDVDEADASKHGDASADEFSGVELSSEDGADEWLHDASVLEGVDAPGPRIISIQEHRVEVVVERLELPRVELPALSGLLVQANNKT